MKKSYHLYYRLPWKAAAVGMRDNPQYQILRSDTEKIVATCDTKKQADIICNRFNKLKEQK